MQRHPNRVAFVMPPPRGDTPQVTTRYGRPHRAIRRQLLPYAYGTDCHLCGETMRPDQHLDLDHLPGTNRYRGMTHASCNRADGGRRGAAATHNKRSNTVPRSRDW